MADPTDKDWCSAACADALLDMGMSHRFVFTREDVNEMMETFKC